MLAAVWSGVVNSFNSLIKVFFVITPLLVFLEVVKETGWLERVSQRLTPALKHFSLSPAAAPALVAGLFIGLIYGAGVLYQTRQEGRVQTAEMTILCLFLSLNHAVIEDVAILAAMGAQAWVLVIARLLPAVILTYLYSRWFGGEQVQDTSITG